MPEWLLRRLESAGHIDRTLEGPAATRRTRTIFCPGCRRGIMRGLTSLPTSWPADVEATPLSLHGEALALLSGLSTYELRWNGLHYTLDRRTPFRYQMAPAGVTYGMDVVVEHRCGTSAAAWPRADSLLIAARPSDGLADADLPTDPPF